MIKHVSPPWTLEGKGYVFIFRFPKDYIQKSPFVPKEWANAFTGGMGSIMFAEYTKSPVGPYREILFIPGKFSLEKLRRYAITKIYVSTEESKENGIINWGIPKERAGFTYQRVSKNAERIRVLLNEVQMLDLTIGFGGPKFPVFTWMKPLPLVQKRGGDLMLSQFKGHGFAQPAHIRIITVNKELFPDFGTFTPIAGFRLDPFKITFPEAKIQKGKAENLPPLFQDH
ncbi:MAG: hypothetical protein ACLFR1_15915 [Spirochaetia bacterium]